MEIKLKEVEEREKRTKEMNEQVLEAIHAPTEDGENEMLR